MKYTMFATPGEFDMRSMIVGGMSAKPNSDSPIGRFGSGLKYAIAILLREGAKLTLHCNGDHYEFYERGEVFRGTSFDRCCYKRTNGLLRVFDDHELPYTTDQGKGWELWQAFRELLANTMDESGWVENLTSDEVLQYTYKKDWTYILVDHLEFGLLVPKKYGIFLDPERPLILDHSIGNVTAEKTQHLFFRNMRAYDLPEDQPALFTYNIKDELELTEDRTIKSVYWARDKIETLVEQSKDKEFIKAVLTAPEKSFEKTLDFAYASSPTNEFKEAVTELRNHKGINRSAVAYYGNYISPPRRKVVEDNIWEMIIDALDSAKQDALEMDKTDIEEAHKIYMKAFQKKFDR